MVRNRVPVQSTSEEESASEVVQAQAAALKKSKSAKPLSPPPSESESESDSEAESESNSEAESDSEAEEEAENSSSRSRSRSEPIAPAKSGSTKRPAEGGDARDVKRSTIASVSEEIGSASALNCWIFSNPGVKALVLNSGKSRYGTLRDLDRDEVWRRMRIEEMELNLKQMEFEIARAKLLFDLEFSLAK